MESAIAMLLYFVTLREHGWEISEALDPNDPNYIKATTVCFASICMIQLFNAFNCRHTTSSMFDSRIKTNRSLIVGVLLGAGLVLFLIYHPIGNLMLRTVPVDFSVWLMLLPLVLIFVLLEEMRKIWVRCQPDRSLDSTRLKNHLDPR